MLRFMLLGLAVCALATTAAARGPNVVFILADDLGINDLGCYGRRDHATPNLDRLAKEGARLTSAYSACPVCSPTRAALLTGHAPARLHLTTFLPGRGDNAAQRLLQPKIRQQLPLEEVTLAEELRAAGYKTAIFGKWHLGGAKFGPLEQGFDQANPGQANTTPSPTEGGKGERDLTRRAIAFMTAAKDTPFYLHLCHNNPHIPLAADPEKIRKHAKAFHPTYAAMMEELDDSVGQILTALDDLKLRDQTLVIFTSDNGGLHVPELRDDAPTHNTPYRAGKGFLYEGGIRVPTIVRYPGVVAAGQVIDTPTISTDWFPTIRRFAKLPALDSTDGRNITPILTGLASPQRTLYWHLPHYTNQGSRPSGALRQGQWKLIEHYETTRAELFDLTLDPGETTDLATKLPTRTTELLQQLRDWRKGVSAQEPMPNPNFDAKLSTMLDGPIDVSRVKVEATAAATSEPLREWRKAINTAKPAKK